MSREIFGTGPYAGFPDRPELQIEWFTETAVDVRERRLATGRPDPAPTTATWGQWIADVERPAEQYRSRYQLHLEEARALLGSGCTGSPAAAASRRRLRSEPLGGTQQGLKPQGPGGGDLPERLRRDRDGQPPVPGDGRARWTSRRRRHRIGGRQGQALARGAPTRAKAARRALRRGERVRARIDVTATDAAGVTETARRNVQLG